jgi:hypothetical protein
MQSENAMGFSNRSIEQAALGAVAAIVGIVVLLLQ